MLNALHTSALDALTVTAKGIGTAASAAAATTEAEKERNRRVSLRVALSEAGDPGGRGR